MGSRRDFEKFLDRSYEDLRNERKEVMKDSTVRTLYDFVSTVCRLFVKKTGEIAQKFASGSDAVATVQMVSLVLRKRDVQDSQVADDAYEEDLFTASANGSWTRSDGTIASDEEVAAALLVRSIDPSVAGWSTYYNYEDGRYFKRTLGNPMRCYLALAFRLKGCVAKFGSSADCSSNEYAYASRAALKDLVLHPYAFLDPPGEVFRSAAIERFRTLWPIRENGLIVAKGLGQDGSDVSLETLYQQTFTKSLLDASTPRSVIDGLNQTFDALAYRGKVLDGPECFE